MVRILSTREIAEQLGQPEWRIRRLFEQAHFRPPSDLAANGQSLNPTFPRLSMRSAPVAGCHRRLLSDSPRHATAQARARSHRRIALTRR